MSRERKAQLLTSTAEAETVATRSRPLRLRLAGAARRPYSRDLGFALVFLAVAVWLTRGLWPDPATRMLALNGDDQALFEWFIAYDARVLLGDFSLVTDRLNAPDGVNLLANTSIIAIGALLAPVTILFGAPVTYAVIVAGNLAGTAFAWYLLFTRGLGTHRAAAAVGGALCGFGPALISHSNNHLHMTAQWLVPAIVWCVLRIARVAAENDPRPQALVWPAVLLAGLVTVQVFIGEEVLFLTALTLLLISIGYAVAAPRRAMRIAPRFLGALLLATGLAAIALARPLWVQFAGPQSVPNGPFSPAYFSADLASYTAFSPLSIGGSEENARLSTGPAEYNAFFGWPLLLVAAGCAAWLWRRPITWAILLAAGVMGWLSLGPQIVVDGVRSERRGLYTLLEGVPVIDGALPMRFAVALIPLIATLLVLALDRALRGSDTARLVVVAAVAAALVPIAPRALPTTDRAPVPAFITQGHWRECVTPGGVLVPVPLPTPPEPDPMRWAAATNAAFGLPEGFFIGPYAARGRASMGTFSQETSHLLKEVARTGEVPQIGDGERDQARRDLAFWGASCVALAGGTAHDEELRITLEALFGPGRQVAGTWTWRV